LQRLLVLDAGIAEWSRSCRAIRESREQAPVRWLSPQQWGVAASKSGNAKRTAGACDVSLTHDGVADTKQVEVCFARRHKNTC